MKKTNIYPTRYCAFDNPNTWAIFEPTEGGLFRHCRPDARLAPVSQLGLLTKCLGEVAVIYIPQQNAHYPDLTDGGYVEVRGKLSAHPDDPIGRVKGVSGYVISGEYTAPTESRKQCHLEAKAKTVAEAMAIADEWLASVTSNQSAIADANRKKEPK